LKPNLVVNLMLLLKIWYVTLAALMLPLTSNSHVFIKTDALCRKEWNMNEMRGQDEMQWVKHLKTFQ
jgi:hypothetical protein